MALSEEKLVHTADRLANIIREITRHRVLSYDKLAKLTGVPRNSIYYFANSRSGDNYDASAVKLENFAKILKWINEASFDEAVFQAPIPQMVADLKLFLGTSADLPYTHLLASFDGDRKRQRSILDRLPGQYFGFRRRGTADAVQVSVFDFTTGPQHTVRWSMAYRQGRYPVSPDDRVVPSKQKMLQLSGFMTEHENALTGVGKRRGSDIIVMVNLLVNTEHDGVILGALSTYSRNEAICRPIVLLPPDPDLGHGIVELSQHAGDQTEEDILGSFPGIKPWVKKLKLGFSVSTKDIEPISDSQFARRTEDHNE